MSEVIELLAKMASDASINSESAYTKLVLNADINEQQQQAFLTNNVDLLKEVSQKIPTIECFAILPAEDDDAEESEEDQESSDKSGSLKLAINI